MITHAAVLWLRRGLWRILWCKSTGIAFGAPPVESALCLHFSPAPCFGAQDAPGHAHAAFTRYVLDRWMVSACHECVRLGGRRSTDGRSRRSTCSSIHACVGWRCQRASIQRQGLPPKMLRFMEPMLFLCFSAVFLLPLLPCCCSLLLTVRCCVAALYCCCVAAV